MEKTKSYIIKQVDEFKLKNKGRLPEHERGFILFFTFKAILSPGLSRFPCIVHCGVRNPDCSSWEKVILNHNPLFSFHLQKFEIQTN